MVSAKAANPRFQDFEPTQFSVAGNKITLLNGAIVTNLTLYTSMTVCDATGTNCFIYHFPATNLLSGQLLTVITNGTNLYFVGTNLPVSTVVFDTIEELVATPIPLPGIGMLAYVRDPLRGGPLAFYPNSVDTTNRFDTYASLDGPGNWKRPPDPNIYVEHGVVTGGTVTNDTLVAALTLQSSRATGKVVYSGTDEFLHTDDVPLLENNVLYFEDGAQATGLVLSANGKTNVAVYGAYHIAAVASPSTGAYYITNSTALIQSPSFLGYSIGDPVVRVGTTTVNKSSADSTGFKFARATPSSITPTYPLTLDNPQFVDVEPFSTTMEEQVGIQFQSSGTNIASFTAGTSLLIPGEGSFRFFFTNAWNYPPPTPAVELHSLGVIANAFFGAYNYSHQYVLGDLGSADTNRWSRGSGTPEGAITGRIGDIYSRINGGAATTLYVKESGTGNTGWVAVGGAAGVGGSGTANRIAKFTAGTTLGNSTIADDGSTVSFALPLTAPSVTLTNGGTIQGVAKLVLGTDESLRSGGSAVVVEVDGADRLHLAQVSLSPASLTTYSLGTSALPFTFGHIDASLYVYGNLSGQSDYQRLEVVSSATNVFNIKPEAVGAVSGNISLNLQSLGTGTVQVNGVPITTGGITGSGTANTMMKFTAGTVAGNSQVTDDAATVIVNGTLGAEKVSNGTFATDLTGWTGANWAWSAGTALHTAGAATALSQAGTAGVIGETYKVVYTISGETVGSVTVFFGGVWGPLRSSNATYTEYLTATSVDTLSFTPTSDFDGALDNVSIKRITAGALTVDGATTLRGPISIFGGIGVANGLPISIGYQALPVNTTGIYNPASSSIGIGYRAGASTTTGHVTAVGFQAGEDNTTGVLTAFGKWAGANNTIGHATFLGNAAGFSNTTSHATAVGDESAGFNTTGTIAALGYYAGNGNVDGIVSAFGYEAGRFIGPSGGLTAIGYKAGYSNTVAGLTAIGQEAAWKSTTGQATGVGYQSLYNNLTGHATAVGYQAGFDNTSGAMAALGWEAGANNTSGRVVAMGYNAGFSNTEGHTIAVGYQAGYSGTTGTEIAIGYNSLFNATTGDLIAIGFQAGYGATPANSPVTDTRGILIGNNANRSVASATVLTNYVGVGDGVLIDKSNQVKIGDTSIIETMLQGRVQVGGASASFPAFARSTEYINVVDAAGGNTAGLMINSGTPLLGVLSATATLDFGNILAAASADLTITVTGAAVGDSVHLGPPAAPDASITFTGFVSSANTVTVRSHNVGGIAVDQASATFRATVMKF